jgi:hypothetical protein
MTTTQTVLVVGGVAVGAFVLLKVLAPPPAVLTKAKANTDVVSLNSLVGLGGALASAFGGSSSSAGSKTPAAVFDTPSGLAATKDEWQNITDYNAQPGTQYGIAGLDY